MRILFIFACSVFVGCSAIPLNSGGRTVASASNRLDSAGAKSILTIENMPVDHRSAGGPTFQYIFESKVVDPKAVTIVFLPGGPGDGSIGRNFLPREFNTVQIDPRGVGRNASPLIKGDLLLSEQVAQDVVDVIRTLELQNYVLFGQSYGTVLATIVASKLGELSLAQPKAIVLEGVLGKAFISWDAWNIEHLAKANLFLSSYPNIAALLSGSTPPLGYPAEFWGNRLFYVGHQWRSQLAAFNSLTSNPSQTNASFKNAFDYWKTEQNDTEPFYDPVYLHVTCRELSPSLMAAPTVTIDNGVVKVLSERSHNYCTGIPFDHGFDSAKYQVKAPIVYFQGSTDPATPESGARYHFENQHSSTSKKFVEVRLGGHNPLSEDLRACAEKIWNGIAEGNFEMAYVLNKEGWCS